MEDEVQAFRMYAAAILQGMHASPESYAEGGVLDGLSNAEYVAGAAIEMVKQERRVFRGKPVEGEGKVDNE